MSIFRRKDKAALIQNYQQIFSTPGGKKVLMDLAKTHHLVSSSYRGEANDTIYREGERAVILRILSFLEIDIRVLLKDISDQEKSIASQEGE